MSWFIKYVFVAFVGIVLVFIYNQTQDVPLPTLEDKWWGKGPKIVETRKITNRQINVPEEVILDLKSRLRNTKPFHPSLDGVNQFYGIHVTALNNVLNYWKNEYNWTERQAYLNQHQHFFVNIRGLEIHFLHIKPKRIVHENGRKLKVLPMLIMHGWPGSVREFYDIIPKLTEPRNDKDFVFELILPSLPGFGFSETSTKPDLSVIQMGQIFADLMNILGFEKFYVQGGDWGSYVAQSMASFYPERVIGLHSNMCYCNTKMTYVKFLIGNYWPGLIYEDYEMSTIYNTTANTLKFLTEETGYFHIQATKPDTVGVGLRDSPMGLAAYMLEKFSTLTNPNYRNLEDAGLTEKFTLEQLLDNVMIFWVTQSMTSAMRIYAQYFTDFDMNRRVIHGTKIYTPTACARFKYEILHLPKSILSERFKNLVYLSQYDQGGHFAAFEEPDLFAEDIYMFVEKVEKM
uniref:Epoxide hydrolase n=1 Tax=Dendroctonus ponderosae TaxID=77166 RepID=J3JTX6_DENPD|nr:unknown [Dendroctonus ponderosae]